MVDDDNDDDDDDAGAWVYYKLTMWAFGSGELITVRLQQHHLALKDNIQLRLTGPLCKLHRSSKINLIDTADAKPD